MKLIHSRQTSLLQKNQQLHPAEISRRNWSWEIKRHFIVFGGNRPRRVRKWPWKSSSSSKILPGYENVPLLIKFTELIFCLFLLFLGNLTLWENSDTYRKVQKFSSSKLRYSKNIVETSRDLIRLWPWYKNL